MAHGVTQTFFDMSSEIMRSWSHTFRVMNYKTFIRKPLVVCPKALRRRRKRKKKRMAIAKLFASDANVKRVFLKLGIFFVLL